MEIDLVQRFLQFFTYAQSKMLAFFNGAYRAICIRNINVSAFYDKLVPIFQKHADREPLFNDFRTQHFDFSREDFQNGATADIFRNRKHIGRS